MSPRALTRPCHAKVNLALAVGPPIPPGSPQSGYHPICSWMACIDLADTLEIIRCDDASTYDIAWQDGRPVDWPIERDLAVRAHRALERRVGRTLPAHVRLRKRIPAGGGLGGGSADAAGVLLGFDELFELGLGGAELRGIAAALGSDIAFFIDDATPARPAIVSGLGDQIDRLDRLSMELVLICPGFPCPTPEVYRAFDALHAGTLDQKLVRTIATTGSLARLFNQLAPAAERVEPRLALLRARIAEHAGAMPHVSGSGSTLFLVGGRELAQSLQRAFPDLTIIPTTTL